MVRQVEVTVFVSSRDEEKASEKAEKLCEGLYVSVTAAPRKTIEFDLDDDGEWEISSVEETE